MTFGVQLPAPANASGAPEIRARASGRIELGRGARLALSTVPLDAIRGQHPALRARDNRLDLASGHLFDPTEWTPDSLEIILCAAPPWVIERGQKADRHFLIVAGGQLVPSLRRVLPGTTPIPAVLVNARFTSSRWLQIAAMHSAAMGGLANSRSVASLRALLKDAQAAGVQLARNGDVDSVIAALGAFLSPRDN